jgi:hypothetical protein
MIREGIGELFGMAPPLIIMYVLPSEMIGVEIDFNHDSDSETNSDFDLTLLQGNWWTAPKKVKQ